MSMILAEVAAWPCSRLHSWRPPEGLLLAHQPHQASSPSAFVATQCPQSLSPDLLDRTHPCVPFPGLPPCIPIVPSIMVLSAPAGWGHTGQLRMPGSGARKVCARWTEQQLLAHISSVHLLQGDGGGPVRAFQNPGKAGRVKV